MPIIRQLPFWVLPLWLFNDAVIYALARHFGWEYATASVAAIYLAVGVVYGIVAVLRVGRSGDGGFVVKDLAYLPLVAAALVVFVVTMVALPVGLVLLPIFTKLVEAVEGGEPPAADAPGHASRNG